MISDAIGFEKKFRLKEDKKFEHYKIMLPKLRENDLMIKIAAISISTLDTQIRQHIKGPKKPYILGFGGVGIITRMGSNHPHLNVGDRVLYVNKVGKYGSYSNFQIVDGRSVVKLPDSFPTDEAAAFSYSFFLAFEVLFKQLKLTPKPGKNQGNLLILNTSDGLGATIIQLAKWAGLNVAATIDKNNSEIWIKNMGADTVFSQSTNLSQELAAAELTPIDYVINLDTEKEKSFDQLGEFKDSAKILLLHFVKRKYKDLDPDFLNFYCEEFLDTTFVSDEGINYSREIMELLVYMWEKKLLRSILTAQLNGFSDKNFYGAHKLIENNPNFRHLVLVNE
ncbi:alcohol dehydrogenase catalytic domain-containing protein [Enterococcus devriesei]|mgnify:CR=1 FL=1|uniref:alcohol dehydrogenase catalytic domain-containing protein n=1 Tax=Enterococcus devriesei TaxID=319970 RepID=UPI001C1099E5|nr:alcohol dehydrogenase catalytic domain-containing protein [Enterococcus devriesei]MBU5366233.1 alcohol dehydrogenase catalytic domain-containing protein [Enterococcus devriesei]